MMKINEPLLVYVAHPYGGLIENKEKVDRIMRYLIKEDTDNVYLSPIHNYGMTYFKNEYAKGLDICLRMLRQCDVLVLCGDWQNSKGCIGEWVQAKSDNIDVYKYDEWVGRLKEYGR